MHPADNLEGRLGLTRLAVANPCLERAGFDGLNRLWEGAHMVPTRPELDAPGLWLARIELG